MVWIRFRTAFNLLLLIATFLFLLSIVMNVRPKAAEPQPTISPALAPSLGLAGATT